MALKYSRQREVIKSYLYNTDKHPTADDVYVNIRKQYPKISLGTVYRNLTLLSDMGEIKRLRVGDGIDHFDADTSPHNHFICSECGCVMDLKMENIDYITEAASKNFGGQILGYTTYFYGYCEDCCSELQTSV